MTTALLDQLPADVPQGPRRARPLLVYPPQARPVYDTVQMAYTQQAHQVAYFAHNQWGETPSQMLQPLLVRVMERTGAFAVLAPPFTGGNALALHTELTQLVQDFTQEPPLLRVALRVQLIDEGSGRLVASRDIALQQPMQQKAPYAGVIAANAAMAQALHDLATFVLESAP